MIQFIEFLNSPSKAYQKYRDERARNSKHQKIQHLQATIDKLRKERSGLHRKLSEYQKQQKDLNKTVRRLHFFYTQEKLPKEKVDQFLEMVETPPEKEHFPD